MTAWLAVYGAGLSPILALAKIIPEWPVVSVAPAQKPDDTPPSVTLVVFQSCKATTLHRRQLAVSAQPTNAAHL